MKKYATLLLAGGILGLAACGNETNTTSQEQIDSAVNARSAAMEAQMKAKNDSLIAAMAKMKADSAMADSIARATAGKSTTTASTKTTTTTTHKGGKTTTTTTSKPITIGNGKPAMGNGEGKGTIGEGKPRMGDSKPMPNTVGEGKPKMGDKK